MATNEIGIRVHGIVDSLRLAPGDVLIIQSHRKLTKEQAEAIQASFKEIFPDNRALVLGPDLTVSSTEVVDGD